MSIGANGLSDADIATINERTKRATKGPWKSFVEIRDKISGSDFIMTAGEDIYISGGTIDDQEFIAHARQDIPILLEEIRRLKLIVAELSNSINGDPSA
ncbi:MAG: hypothetical protein HY834_20530 [Devosia nanyangense]|uniref:Uncharacterized protein n=1 Tax=Devosia nanyangense TaxID=1228055 RepID=A0A933L4K9_9HYPH|nr:hypothetical protein [Devosia nanyangense]